MKKSIIYIGQWFSDWYFIFARELKHIFRDSGVLIIFFLACLAYPVLYGLIYSNGILENMPVAVVDNSGSSASRRFIRKLDATREIEISRTCRNMDEAEKLMQKREVHGIVMIPSDFGANLETGRQGTVSTYADMSSFIYYKNLTMGVNMVMLDEMDRSSGPIKYEDNIPYNRAFSYGVFFLSAILLIIIQQTMFFGISMMSGTMREENRSYAILPERLDGRGISRTVLGRGAAYWLLYVGIGVYVLSIAPKLIGMPQNCPFGDIFILLMFFVSACVVFSFTFSVFIRHRETVFVIFLLMSVVCLFLTGFSWPSGSFPKFWEAVSWIFPSTFAVRAFMNMNTAGAGLSMAEPQIAALTIQIIAYYILACLEVFIDNVRRTRRERGIPAVSIPPCPPCLPTGEKPR